MLETCVCVCCQPVGPSGPVALLFCFLALVSRRCLMINQLDFELLCVGSPFLLIYYYFFLRINSADACCWQEFQCRFFSLSLQSSLWKENVSNENKRWESGRASITCPIIHQRLTCFSFLFSMLLPRQMKPTKFVKTVRLLQLCSVSFLVLIFIFLDGPSR